jgi:heme/copper-type cytochrome/quinol oxidase subunit 2
MGNLRKGLAVMLRCSLLIGLALVVLFAPAPVNATIPVERTFRIEASRFQYSPAVLQVNPGDRVTIDLVAQDVVHGLSIDGYNLAITADPGQTAHLSFIADRPGSFHFHCSVTCGNLHPFMTGKLEVGSNLLFWRAAALAFLALVAGAMRLWK